MKGDYTKAARLHRDGQKITPRKTRVASCSLVLSAGLEYRTPELICDGGIQALSHEKHVGL